MAVHHIRLEANDRKRGQCRVTEEGKLLQVIQPVTVRLRATEIGFIINKVKRDPIVDVLHDSDITALSQIIHIEMIDISHLIAPFFRNAQIFRYHDPNVKILLVKALWQRTNHISKPSCLDKWNCF